MTPVTVPTKKRQRRKEVRKEETHSILPSGLSFSILIEIPCCLLAFAMSESRKQNAAVLHNHT